MNLSLLHVRFSYVQDNNHFIGWEASQITGEFIRSIFPFFFREISDIYPIEISQCFDCSFLSSLSLLLNCVFSSSRLTLLRLFDFPKFHTSLIRCHATVAIIRPHVKLKTITIAYTTVRSGMQVDKVAFAQSYEAIREAHKASSWCTTSQTSGASRESTDG